jgi:histone H2A
MYINKKQRIVQLIQTSFSSIMSSQNFSNAPTLVTASGRGKEEGGAKKRVQSKGRGKGMAKKVSTASSSSKSLDLRFSVGRIHRNLKEGRYAPRISKTAAMYLAGVFEYLTKQIFRPAVGAALDYKKSRITSHFLEIGISRDEELDSLFANHTLAAVGFVPHDIDGKAVSDFNIQTKRALNTNRRMKKKKSSRNVASGTGEPWEDAADIEGNQDYVPGMPDLPEPDLLDIPMPEMPDLPEPEMTDTPMLDQA